MEYYSDGKMRDDKEAVRKLEKAYGIDQLSPFGTNHTKLFEERLEGMDIEALNNLAHKVRSIVSADVEEQKNFIRESFKAHQRINPPDYAKGKGRKGKLDMRKNADKKVMKDLDFARTKSTFEKEFPKDTVESFRKLTNTYTLADLQNLAARCGFNPTWDRRRIQELLVGEFSKDLRSRS
jgi:hypothetical protein